MTLTPLHPLDPKSVRHVAAAAARSPFLRGPGTTFHTMSDCAIPDSPVRSGSLPRRHHHHHHHGLQVDVDPMIEEAWEAAVSSFSDFQGAFEGPSKAIKEGGASLAKKAHEVGEAVWKTLEPTNLPWSREHSPRGPSPRGHH
ncbi:hypothetical protein CLOM_g7672 [Closterium sp. NIES-68]|nr:hypothetical protein CLOM_g7672 [Closterium sp. NIES-68]GJP82539.1 hypothetical protein CLOP_g12784 [Closterium sp. NIES-67]